MSILGRGVGGWGWQQRATLQGVAYGTIRLIVRVIRIALPTLTP